MDVAEEISKLKERLSEESQKEPVDQSLLDALQKEFEELEKTQIPFTVSARTARLIGQENFANAEGAIIELVKNSYDADASICVIIIDPVNDCIQILDNGHGMTDNVIRKQWMTIGTDDKKVNFRTASRVKTGAKGIGRFALDKLGEKSVMVTKTDDSDNLIWEVNWNQFNSNGAVISDIKATLQKHDQSLLDVLSEIQKNAGIQAPVRELWSEEKGTLITISKLKDQWDNSSVQSLYSNLEILVPPLETNIFQVYVYSTLEPEQYGKVIPTLCDDYDYKVTADVKEDQTVKITLFRNELNVGDLKRLGFFEQSKLNQDLYSFKVFESGSFEIDTTLEALIAGFKEVDKNNSLEKIGPFTFSYYFMKRGGGQDKGDGINWKNKPF